MSIFTSMIYANSLFSFVGIKEYIKENVKESAIDNETDDSIEVNGIVIKEIPKGFQVGSTKKKYSNFKGIDALQGFLDGVLKQQGLAASKKVKTKKLSALDKKAAKMVTELKEFKQAVLIGETSQVGRVVSKLDALIKRCEKQPERVFDEMGTLKSLEDIESKLISLRKTIGNVLEG